MQPLVRTRRSTPHASTLAVDWQGRELDVPIQEAKAAFDAEMYRRWKRAKKKRHK